jgi:transcription antitermination factor NusG
MAVAYPTNVHRMNAVEKLDESGTREWFALRVKSNCEKIVASVVQQKGFEEFLPLYRSRQRWSDRYKWVELPLFPGYVFCRIDPRFRLPILTIPGALQFIGIGKTPVPIEEHEIAAIQRAVQTGFPASPCEYLKAGQLVRFDDGPLAGLEGILVESRKQCRVVVSVTLLKRSVAVEIERDWVTPLGTDRRPLTIRCAVGNS